MLSTPNSQAEGPRWPVARVEAIHSSLGAFWGLLPCPTLNFPSKVVVVLANNTMHFFVVLFIAYVYLVLMSPLGVQIFAVPHRAAIVQCGKTRGGGVWNCVIHILLMFQMNFSVWQAIGSVAGVQWYHHMWSSFLSRYSRLVSVQTSCTCGGGTRSLEVVSPGTVAVVWSE